MATILVIDDNVLVQDMIKQALLRAGHAVETAANGRIGLKLMASRRFDFVVTDIVMPEQEGFETIQLLRQITRRLPILAVSGAGKLGRADLLDLARRMGATDVLPKPFEPAELVAKVAAMLAAATTGEDAAVDAARRTAQAHAGTA